MAELVLANGPSAVYPGGVVVFRATDWIAGSATEEADTLAAENECVRETQQVTTAIIDDPEGAYGEAVDTFEIPLAGIGIEENFNYDVFVSYRLEGEWDDTDLDVLAECRQDFYRFVGMIGIHGTEFETEEFPMYVDRFLCRIPHYSIAYLGDLFDVDSTQTLHIRAFTQSGTTAEFVIDQVVLLPRPDGASWTDDDFEFMDGQFGIFADAGPPVDGADAGDDNGQFTLIGAVPDTMQLPAAEGGDYQRKADGDDAEWLMQVTTDDALMIRNSVTDAEAGVNVYGLYCARYRPESSPVEHDDFSNRTTSSTGQDWGNSPQGYGYAIGASVQANSPFAFVNGVGVLRARQSGAIIGASWGGPAGGAGLPDGAGFTFYDQFQWSGRWRWATGDSNTKRHRLIAFADGGGNGWEIRFDMGAETWTLGHWDGITFTALGSAHDISSWFSVTAWVEFRLEIKRYVVRCRVWDSTGAEPSTWDEELFKPHDLGGAPVAYDYSDNVLTAIAAYDHIATFTHQLEVGSVGPTVAAPMDIEVSDNVIEFDPYGDPGDMSARLERPEGTLVDDIVIPYGATYFVNWGSRDMTDLVTGTPYLEFSQKVWNETGVAEMQRAECELMWFRSIHGGIVSMNWSSATPFDITRIHA